MTIQTVIVTFTGPLYLSKQNARSSVDGNVHYRIRDLKKQRCF